MNPDKIVPTPDTESPPKKTIPPKKDTAFDDSNGFSVTFGDLLKKQSRSQP